MRQLARWLRGRGGEAVAEVDRLTGEVAQLARQTVRQAGRVARNARRPDDGGLGGWSASWGAIIHAKRLLEQAGQPNDLHHHLGAMQVAASGLVGPIRSRALRRARSTLAIGLPAGSLATAASRAQARCGSTAGSKPQQGGAELGDYRFHQDQGSIRLDSGVLVARPTRSIAHGGRLELAALRIAWRRRGP
jgi:hypothetical protein